MATAVEENCKYFRKRKGKYSNAWEGFNKKGRQGLLYGQH